MILLPINIPGTNLEQRLYFEGRLEERLVGPRLGRSDHTYSVVSRLALTEMVVMINARRISVSTGKICVE